ncbi:MAG: hypothetical protein OXF79_12145 [Chloroflexi bacterium]|nr:hypothetical protein [Chloroflexota bacterium]
MPQHPAYQCPTMIHDDDVFNDFVTEPCCEYTAGAGRGRAFTMQHMAMRMGGQEACPHPCDMCDLYDAIERQART